MRWLWFGLGVLFETRHHLSRKKAAPETGAAFS
ncbi:hypothetical protein GA0071312_1349 [Saliniramus fredricksonii]|uniref:Uncharacterized protein n=1 Tax=Saliniramus fredricksonii TaxID=1653334 RepID=A0ABY0K7H1_9HYPH|nr:hypothetical protein GA0071312_1349 [Saliniramus fredricksonii]